MREYADIADLAAAARARLAAAESEAGAARTKSSARLSLQLAWGPGAIVNWNSFTRDGRFMTYFDLATGNVMLRDLEAGAGRPLAAHGGRCRIARWPDDRPHLVLLSKDKGGLGTELRVTNIDGTQRPTLASWDGKTYVGRPAWTSVGNLLRSRPR